MRTIVAAGLLMLSLTSISAQDYRIGQSTGTAEIELPGSGWLQAVSGRSVPGGANLATWLDSSVTVVAEGITIEIGELSAVGFVELDESGIVLELITGVVIVESVGMQIELLADGVSIRSGSARFAFGDGVLSVSDGQVELARESGVDETVSAPASIRVVVPEASSLFR